ncbi:hypothetical protein ASPSYDRAFT_140067 [Aspergillus sydowii CBS 593.65]|uniref:Amine oxidase domain-containing protein n=1 Tax=Aspergillus sydowii CBS 593.65 TaxID=1036612 RepID=A0A1L9U0T7_9EURO|nr:uncharacterized protein ASPSYDRAFT_140067 [Aspergillus sydowii CBS 593.65]OJJ65279.1 hypothetical protein ASPSYDRAFT_140067 [Aspergillus sydowii CBS 593.65]
MRLALNVLGAVLAISTAAAQDTIDRDVVILGGGATGTYAAVQLRAQGKSVALVEQKSRLGGHAETLYLPNGKHVNYGVEGYFNNELTKSYFSQLNVEYEPLLPGSLLSQYVNFDTGERVLPGSELLTTVVAATLYRGAIEQFDYLSTGAYYLPDEVPEELLRPFREFVEKHALQGAMDLIFTFAENVGNILDQPLIYVIQNFGIPQVDALLQGGYITPKNGTDELFNAAANYIDESNNIFYNSAASHTVRSEKGVQVTIQNSKTGGERLIRAKKLLVAFPPTLPKLEGFDLGQEEKSLFSKWTHKNYYAAAITNTAIPDGFNILNTNPAVQPGSLPTTPFQWSLEYSGEPGYFMSKIVGEDNLTESAAREMVINDIKRMSEAGTFEIKDGKEPELAAFASHSPETLMVPIEDIKNGFYKRLYGLQGVRSTYYTGYTFCTDYSTPLWNYTMSVVDSMGL